MSEQEHIDENLRIAGEALPRSLTKEELSLITRVETKYREILKVGCTGCRYCMPCPAGVNIPLCFEEYNNLYLVPDPEAEKFTYATRLGGCGRYGIGGVCIPVRTVPGVHGQVPPSTLRSRTCSKPLSGNSKGPALPSGWLQPGSSSRVSDRQNVDNFFRYFGYPGRLGIFFVPAGYSRSQKCPSVRWFFAKISQARQKTALFFYLRCIRSSACAEEVVWLVGPQAVFLVVRAYTAVLHTDLPVLIGIFNGNRADCHNLRIVRPQIRGFSWRIQNARDPNGNFPLRAPGIHRLSGSSL